MKATYIKPETTIVEVEWQPLCIKSADYTDKSDENDGGDKIPVGPDAAKGNSTWESWE